jgi:high-affinity K+ transport system ATPase subunit B
MAYELLQTHILAKQIVMTRKSLRNFSIHVNVAVKHFTRDGINQL